MRPEWYGDKRDVVKWSVLLGLAQRCGIKRILQVAMCPPVPSEPTDRAFHGLLEQIPMEKLFQRVTAHFPSCKKATNPKRLLDVKGLGKQDDINIEVFDEPFSNAFRESYFKNVLNRVALDRDEPPKIVFVDPDTGIAHGAKLTRKHITCRNLYTIFKGLRPGDYLACYQHSRHEKGWKETARARMELALGSLPRNGGIKMCWSDYDKDVMILVAKRG